MKRNLVYSAIAITLVGIGYVLKSAEPFFLNSAHKLTDTGGPTEKSQRGKTEENEPGKKDSEKKSPLSLGSGEVLLSYMVEDPHVNPNLITLKFESSKLFDIPENLKFYNAVESLSITQDTYTVNHEPPQKFKCALDKEIQVEFAFEMMRFDFSKAIAFVYCHKEYYNGGIGVMLYVDDKRHDISAVMNYKVATADGDAGEYWSSRSEFSDLNGDGYLDYNKHAEWGNVCDDEDKACKPTFNTGDIKYLWDPKALLWSRVE